MKNIRNPVITINGVNIGRDFSPYMVAEISSNHCGSLQTMLETIRAAKRSGADAVKIQTYEPKDMTVLSDRAEYKINSGIWEGRTLWEIYSEACTPFAWHEEIFSFARSIGITIFSTP